MRMKQSKQWVAYMEPFTTYIYIFLLLTKISIFTSMYPSEFLYLYKQLLRNHPLYTSTHIYHVIRVTHFIKFVEKNRKSITKCLVYVFNKLSTTKLWIYKPQIVSIHKFKDPNHILKFYILVQFLFLFVRII